MNLDTNIIFRKSEKLDEKLRFLTASKIDLPLSYDGEDPSNSLPGKFETGMEATESMDMPDRCNKDNKDTCLSFENCRNDYIDKATSIVSDCDKWIDMYERKREEEVGVISKLLEFRVDIGKSLEIVRSQLSKYTPDQNKIPNLLIDKKLE